MIYRTTANTAAIFTTRKKVMNIRIVILILITLMTGCAKNPHPDHLKGISCPKKNHGPCPFGCNG